MLRGLCLARRHLPLLVIGNGVVRDEVEAVEARGEHFISVWAAARVKGVNPAALRAAGCQTISTRCPRRCLDDDVKRHVPDHLGTTELQRVLPAIGKEESPLRGSSPRNLLSSAPGPRRLTIRRAQGFVWLPVVDVFEMVDVLVTAQCVGVQKRILSRPMRHT